MPNLMVILTQLSNAVSIFENRSNIVETYTSLGVEFHNHLTALYSIKSMSKQV